MLPGPIYVCMYVCMYVCICGQKFDLFSALLFKKLLLYVLYYLILEFKNLQVVIYIQQVVQTEQFVCVLFKIGPEIMHYGMPRLYAITLQRRFARLCECSHR